jgi:hypothetical protein
MSVFGLTRGDTVRAFMGAPAVVGWARRPTKQERLRKLAIHAYHAAATPTEAKMAGILCDLYAPDVSASADNWQ